MKIHKKIPVLILIFTFCLHICVSASILGSTQISGSEFPVSEGLTLYKNVFLSDQSGVGQQRENFFHYIPNSSTLPRVTVGEYVYGSENINQIYSYLKNNEITPVGGVNGDFFSLETGIPIGQVVIDKKIITDDGNVMPAIAFMNDGTAFIDDYDLDIVMWADGVRTELPYFNKYLQRWNYYLFDNNYYEKITPHVKASYITFEIEKGEPVIGGVVTTKVLSIEKDCEGEKTIPENQLILAVTDDASEKLKKDIERFYPEQIVEFTFNTKNNEKWENALHILASSAGQLIKNSESVNDSKEIAAPRTAVGIKEDGTVIFYTIDGRQKGHSYGVRIPTLIERLLELGCTDALNLDGGGSTTISAAYAGTSDFSLINSPSDGALRRDSTYIFFENTAEKTEELSKLFIYPENYSLLSGSKTNFDTKATDGGYHPMKLTSEPEYYIGEDKLKKNEGGYTLNGDGVITLTAKAGDVSAHQNILCIKTPDSIDIRKDEEKVKSLTVEIGEKIDLDAISYYNTVILHSTPEAYSWKVDEKLGTIDENGILKAENPGNGYIEVTAGNKTEKISLLVKSDERLMDIEGNWARNYIEFLHAEKVVTGEEIEGYFYFHPFEQVTRNQLAVILSKSLGLNTEEYKNVTLPFDDKENIPDWAMPYVKAIYSNGILKGAVSGDKLFFNPDSKITRAEAFTTVGRILNLEYENECSFSDRSEIPDWAIEYVDALYDNGMINGYDNNTLRPLSNVTKAELSKIIVKSIYSREE